MSILQTETTNSQTDELVEAFAFVNAENGTKLPKQHFADTKRRPGTARKNPAGALPPEKKREIKVTTRETRPMHEFRAGMAKAIRRLPKRLQGPMFAHVICTDIKSGQHTYSLPTMATYSAAIAPKYKLPVANVASLKRYNPRLAEMGLVAREDRYGVYDAAGAGVQASRVSSLTKLDVEALKALMPEAIAAESATYAATDAATEGAPVSIPTVYASIEAKASERSTTSSSSPPDDEVVPLSSDDSAVQDVIGCFPRLAGSIKPDTLAARMAAEAQAKNITMEQLARAVIQWGTSGNGVRLQSSGYDAGYFINSLPTIWGQYEQHQADQAAVQAADQARVKLAQDQLDQAELDRREKQRQKKERLARTWVPLYCNKPEFWFPCDDDRCVQDDRPPVDAGNYQIWLSASENDQAGKLMRQAGINSMTSDQVASVYGGPDFEKVRVYHPRGYLPLGRVGVPRAKVPQHNGMSGLPGRGGPAWPRPR